MTSSRPGQAYAYFLRSPHAHAERLFASIAEAATKMPGVVAIFTGADLADDKIGGLICGWMIHSKDGSPMNAGAHPALAQGKVRYVGDALAVVIAESLPQAKDAAEAIKVDYRVLPAVIDLANATAALVRSTRRCAKEHRLPVGARKQSGTTDAAFAKAAPCDEARHRQQPPGAQCDGAAGGYRRL